MTKAQMPAPGDELELLVSDLNTDGGAVARHDGLVYFIDRGLPGEVLLAKVVGAKKNFVEAVSIKTIRESSTKVEPFCRWFGECGGCVWQNMDYEAQLVWKRGRVEAALARIAKIEAYVPPVISSPAITGFRNKMEYAFAMGENGARLGLRKRFSHDVCDTDTCPLQSAGCGEILKVTRDWAVQNGFNAWNGQNGVLRHLVLREPAYQPNSKPERMAELICGNETPPAPLLQALWEKLQSSGVTSMTVSQRKKRDGLAKGERILRRFGTDTLQEKIGHLLLEFPPQGFVQTNTAAAEVLYEQVARLAGIKQGDVIWDIYSGVGALGLYLASDASELVGIELENEAVKIAKQNAISLGYNHASFISGDAAKALPGIKGHPHILVTDPPRSGMSPRLIPAIKARAPETIIYVSCDPSTLARDIAALAPKYQLVEIAVVDMFPHTPHVESVARLELV